MSFFFQAEDGIRDADVTGVQTCALPISSALPGPQPVHATSQSQQPERTAQHAPRNATGRLIPEGEHGPDAAEQHDQGCKGKEQSAQHGKPVEISANPTPKARAWYRSGITTGLRSAASQGTRRRNGAAGWHEVHLTSPPRRLASADGPARPASARRQSRPRSSARTTAPEIRPWPAGAPAPPPRY